MVKSWRNNYSRSSNGSSAVKLLIILGVILMFSVKKLNAIGPEFKMSEDKKVFDSGGGNPEGRFLLRTFNRISIEESGKPGVCTSWYRSDHTAHGDGSAVDFRRWHDGNPNNPTYYTAEEVHRIDARLAREGIQGGVISEGTANEHWHLGRITYANRG